MVLKTALHITRRGNWCCPGWRGDGPFGTSKWRGAIIINNTDDEKQRSKRRCFDLFGTHAASAHVLLSNLARKAVSVNKGLRTPRPHDMFEVGMFDCRQGTTSMHTRPSALCSPVMDHSFAPLPCSCKNERDGRRNCT